MDISTWLSVAELLDFFEQADQGESSLWDDAWLRQMVHWIVDEVGQPQPALGRAGDLCPFVRPAVTHRLLFIEKYSGDHSSAALISAFMLDRARTFLERSPALPDPISLYKSLLVAFPEMLLEHTPVLQAVRQNIKPSLLAIGLTCGEFYPSSDDCSVRNRQVFVARSPVPCIAVRYLSAHDILFLRSQPNLLPIFAEHFPEHARDLKDGQAGGDSTDSEAHGTSARAPLVDEVDEA